MTRYVTGFAFSEDRKVVALIEKTKPAWQAGKFNGIGGKVEDNESPGEAMVREFKEETGLETTVESWNDVCSFTGENFVVDFFSRFNDDMRKVTTTTEEEVWLWAVDSVLTLSNIIPNLKWLIPMALDDKGGRISAQATY